MKLSKKEEAKILKVYKSYWDGYLQGDIENMAALLDDNYTQVGSAESEVFFNKKEAVQFLHDTIDQVAGKAEIRNQAIKMEVFEGNILINDLFDIYVLTENEWVFYSKFRASTLMKEINGSWKFIHQHSSVPDIRTQDGENLATDKIAAENLQLRDAIKRRTIELEHKNRELEIENALERVRARTMAMQHSDELPEVANVLFLQVQALGVPAFSAGFNILSEDKQSCNCSMSDEGLIQPSFHLPLTGEKSFRKWIEAIERRDTLFIQELRGKDLEEHYKYLLSLPGGQETIDIVEEAGYSLPTYQINHLSFFRYGFLLFITHEKVPDAHEIFKRFAIVFEQTYTRFLDLQKAEAQIRDVRIEAALERVRMRTMAMHKSEELGEVAMSFYIELSDLGVTFLNCGYVEVDEKNNVQHAWMTDNDGGFIDRVTLPLQDDPVLQKRYKGWKRKDPVFQQVVGGKALKKHIESVAPRLGSEGMENLTRTQFPDPTIFYCGNFPNGYLHLITGTTLSEEETVLFGRFTRVFEQTYTRFLDLKKAEAQAREAQIEAALEKVRGRAMAMHKSDELLDVGALLYQELIKLGIENLTSGYVLMDEDEKIGWNYLSDNGKIFPKPMGVPHQETEVMRAITKSWRMKDPYLVIQMDEKGTIAHQTFIAEHTINFHQTPEELIALTPERLALQTFNFKEGYLLIVGAEPLTDDQIEMILRFAKVFEMTYRRFLDLQKAEAQAREAQIEVALEKVRSSSLAMHRSEELQGVVNTVIERFEELDISLDTTNICVFNKQQRITEFWTGSNSTGKQLTAAWEVAWDYNLPWLKEFLPALESGREVITDCYPFEVKNKIFDYLFSDTDFKNLNPERKKFILDAPLFTPVTAIVKDVGIQVVSYSRDSFLPNEIEIIKRFAKVFYQAYTRFLDIQKAEAQAREAQIEVALERVRARSMAMHHSSDLRKVVGELFSQAQHLGFEIQMFVIFIIKPEGGFEWWSTGVEEGQLPKSYYIPAMEEFKNHPRAKNLLDIINKKKPYRVFELSGEDKKSWDKILLEKTELKQLPARVKRAMKSLDRIVLSDAKLSHGILEVAGPVALSDEKAMILQRFARVFEQTYTRFLDVQKAEAQAREAQIEVALERVRARAMAMHKSEELAEAAELLYRQLQDLGIDPWTCGYVFIEEEKEQAKVWMTEPNGKFFWGLWAVPLREEKVLKDRYKSWKRKEDIHIRILKGQDNIDHHIYIAEHSPVSLDEIVPHLPADLVLTSANFSHGYLLVITELTLSIEEEIILKRFAKVFELTYTRFLDLQNAEALTREAQIETALEKVRSRSLAMHKSEQLLETSKVLFEQFESLGKAPDRIGIIIINEEVKEFEVWGTDQIGSQLNHRLRGSLDEATVMSKMYIAWKKGKDSNVIDLSGQDLKDWMKYTREIVKLPVDDTQIKDRRVQQAAFFSHGMILFTSNDPVGDETMRLLVRFAKVFDQAYTRFLDLQKAEAQAREAKIEASLERVRSRSIAMHKSDELSEVATLLSQELKTLDITQFAACGFVLNDEKNKIQHVWDSRSDLKLLDFFDLPLTGDPVLDERYTAWKRKDPVFYQKVGGDKLKNHLEFCWPAASSTKEQNLSKQDIPDPTYFYYGNFSHGYLHILGTDTLDKEQQAVLARFTKVFEQTYTRFLDLKQAEAQAREAQIETALERVRSRSMAIHRSEELSDVAYVLFEQLKNLDVQLRWCWFSIFDDDLKGMNAWFTDVDGQFNPTPIHQKFQDFEDVKAVFKAWKANQPIYLNEIKGKNLISYIKELGKNHKFRQGLTYPVFRKNVSGCLYQTHAIFKYGYIGYSDFEPRKNETLQFINRFAKVFEQTYTRFLDLKKAEVQTREAQIEAALERVRSKALAMQNSGDLLEVANVLREQMGNLDQPELESSIVHLYNDGARTFEAWYAFRPPDNPDGKIVTGTGYISVDSSAWSKETMSKYQSSNNEYTIVSKGKKLKEWYNVLSKVAPDTLEYDDNGNMIVPKILYYHYSKFSGGSLLLISNQKPSDEAKELQRRAAKVFNLAYQRFLDLQQAEIRAKEAVKQSSLDRVRAEIASMRSTEDLQRITPIVWTELITLGVPFFRCGVFIFDENEQTINAYVSTPQGKSLGVLRLSFDSSDTNQKAVESWRKQKVYSDHWDKKQFKAWTQSMVDLGQIKEENQFQGGEAPPDSLSLQFIPFTQGMLYVGSREPLSDEQINLVKSLAEAFSVAYARYEDFSKLEEAKGRVENTLTELRAAQNQLIQSEKMASLGELTAGIAHEIQNPLNFVNNFSEVSEELLNELEEELEKGKLEEVKEISADIIENLKKIHHHGQRASGIVKGMLEHSRTGDGKKELSDINILADEYLRLAYHGLRAKDKSFNANFKTDFDDKLPKLNVIPQDIGRVLLNLINNAFYAVDKKTKHPSPEASDVKVKDGGYKPLVSVSTNNTGDKVEIRVKDNGDGIPEQVRDKIFQPFFTTKPTGQGTGLGLSLSYDIVKSHGGELKVTSKETVGTEFIVILPYYK